MANERSIHFRAELIAGTGVAVAAITASFLTSTTTAMLIVVLVAVAIAGAGLWQVAAVRARIALDAERDQLEELTEYRARWQRLRQEAAQTSTALSKMRDGVVMLADNNEVLLFNPAARRLLNLAPEQHYQGRRFGEIVRVPDLTRAVAAAAGGEGSPKVAHRNDRR